MLKNSFNGANFNKLFTEQIPLHINFDKFQKLCQVALSHLKLLIN